MLKQSDNEFLVSWDLDNVVKYNVISHLVDFGFLEDSEMALHIHKCYMMMLNGLEIQAESLEDELNSIESLNLIIREDIRGAFLNTPRSMKIFNVLEAAKNNIYLPNKMLKKVSEFHEQVCNFMFREVFGIIRREEARIEEAVIGDSITLDFDHIFNEIMEKGAYLKPEYHKLKKEIRKVLMIDTKW